ncbi:formyltransferase family protein [Geomobilimonas luticola]|uniref:Formyl transferase N-terminal domain-containing protein n=1 Tax=Geomobilimonas luticola TaxID=1114878 RepID=A0ABS5SGG1_9BACT|nr:formyltransferase family protein [Geomobilimonas luticola]MBT0653112.1 hypothetical protein [Geomobilimonas luticola]
MNISILCSNKEHPVFPTLEQWQQAWQHLHEIELVQTRQDLSGGDILFLISCSELIKQDVRNRYRATLVIHASDLPQGRGWSPHIWQILEGRKSITVSLLEAEDKVDSGAIWAQRELLLEGHELYNEINEKLFSIEKELMDFALLNLQTIVPTPQRVEDPSYYRKRTPIDSQIDPHRSIAEQFDLLRVADTVRFPAFFEYRGHYYRIIIEKISNVGELE